MAQLSSEERIRRVELAPKEVQTMVAKAFLRDDIDDEDVQYTFNTDTFEEMNEEGATRENTDAVDVEGIGAAGFVMRTTKPSGNKNFMTTGTGGWSTCIKGSPNDPNATVLANCVGYTSGRFNEIINLARDTAKCTYTGLNCNAENFVERAINAGLKTGSTPRRGAIMCWQKGSLSGSDGAGHVAIVEKVNSNSSVYTSESGYGSSTPFWNQTRTNSNGRWGMSSGYSFRCFIYLPDDVQKLIDGDQPTPTPTPVEGWPKSHTVVKGDTLSGIAKMYYGSGDAAHYNFIANANGIANPNIIHVGQVLTIPQYGDTPAPTPTPTPTPVPTGLQVGDTVKIVGTGNGSTYGTANTAYGIGWTRSVLRIWDGRPYPYQIGNNTGTTGFYKAEALQKK